MPNKIGPKTGKFSKKLPSFEKSKKLRTKFI